MTRNDRSVLLQTDGAVATITLNRPESLNAFNEAMKTDLLDALESTGGEAAVRCVIITGQGRAFTSGQDLADLKGMYNGGEAPNLGDILRDAYNPLIRRIRTLEKPVIAAVNGVAAGAGCNLALACDLRIASVNASFIQAFIHVGLIPDCGGTFFLPRLVGLGRALEMCCTGRKVGAEEALQVGLVDRVVPPEELAATTTGLAHKLAALPTKAVALTKQLMNASFARDLDTQLEAEADAQAAAARTADHVEGVQAFLDKRMPRFEGR